MTNAIAWYLKDLKMTVFNCGGRALWVIILIDQLISSIYGNLESLTPRTSISLLKSW